MNAPPDIAPRHAIDNPVIGLLLFTHQYIRIFHGEKRTVMRKKRVEAANWSAAGLLGHDEAQYPSSPQAAFRMLFASCLDFADQMNIPRHELVEAFNARAESGVRGVAGRTDENVDRMFAALLTMLVERQKAVIAIEEPGERRSA